jgi:hypothetical protein
MDELDRIFKSDRAEIEKLAQAFEWITGQHIQHGELELELLRAMRDEETLVKEQIKLSTIKYLRGVFNDCFQRATGRRAWDE